jgi:hypothetical protein
MRVARLVWFRCVERGESYLDLEPLNSDEKDLTNAIKVGDL